jgi:outer membrane protein OmpA-like peptidoglycan-associated protein
MRSTIAVISLAALGLLAWVGVARVAPAFEADLRARAVEAAGGIGPDLSVEVAGRDLRLTGALPAGVSGEQAIAVLAALPGVGAVADETSPAPPPPEPSPPAAEAAAAIAPEPEDVAPAPDDAAPAPEDVAAPEDVVAPEDAEDAEDSEAVGEIEPGPTEPAAVAPDADGPGEPPLNLAALEVDEVAAVPAPPVPAPATPAPVTPTPATPSSGPLDLAKCREAVRVLTLSRADRIGFAAPDSAELSADGLAALRRYAAVLARCPTVTGVIEGFHHNIGNPDRIRALTLKRAEAALVALGRLGVDVARFRPKGLGYLHPRYRNNDAERHLNERVEIKIGVK